jgi:hypothetical protein
LIWVAQPLSLVRPSTGIADATCAFATFFWGSLDFETERESPVPITAHPWLLSVWFKNRNLDNLNDLIRRDSQQGNNHGKIHA